VKDDELIIELECIEAERFSCNSYRGLPAAPAFEIVSGTLPVIVSTPHAVTHVRDGRPKPSEDYTGAMALVLAHECGCHAIVASRTSDCDPNHDPLERSRYKQALVAYVREQGIRLLIDLHGMSAASGALVALGTADGTTVRADPEVRDAASAILRERLTPLAERFGRTVEVDGELAARGEHTVCATVARECGIACLQIEMATQVRVPWTAGGIPEGERPYRPDALADEVAARTHPDSAAVIAMVRTLEELVCRSYRT
jgi:hypothetical protein